MVVVDPRMGDETEFIQVVPSITATGVAWLAGAQALQPPKKSYVMNENTKGVFKLQDCTNCDSSGASYAAIAEGAKPPKSSSSQPWRCNAAK